MAYILSGVRKISYYCGVYGLPKRELCRILHDVTRIEWGGSNHFLWMGRHMKAESHIESLEKKHLSLEKELHTILASPSSCDQEIADIKRRKLQIRDEIEHLKKK